MQRTILLVGILALLLPAPGASSQEDSFAYDAVLKWKGERHKTLGPTGRRIFAERMEAMPGLRGAFGYCHTTTGFKDPLILEFRTEAGDLSLTMEEVTWRPSRLEVVWAGGKLRLEESKFITDDDMMVDRVTVINTSNRSLGIEIHLSSRITPLLERSRSEQKRLDLSEAANIQDLPPSLPEGGAFEYRVPEQIPLRPGILEYDSIGFFVPDPGPNDRPILAALRGGIEGDPAHALPEDLSFRVADLRPALAVLHLLVMCPAPRGRGIGSAPAFFEFRFDDASTESVPWPSVSSKNTKGPQDRAEWHFLVLPGTKEPAMRLAYTPPPGRFIREVMVKKGEGPEVPVLLAGTFEILPKDGRLPVLLGKPDYHGLSSHFVLAGDGFSPLKTPGGVRGLYRYIPLEPGASRTFNVLLACGRKRFMTALKAMDAARDESLFEKHLAAYRKWYDENAPRFSCSDPFMERAWHYRWYLARQAMVRLDTPDFTLPVFYDGIHADAHTWVSPHSSSHILSEVRWLRDRRFAQGQIRALLKQQYPNGLIPRVRTNAREGIFIHWLPAAAFNAFKVNGSAQYLKEILPLLKNNLDAVFEHFDPDGDLLPSLIHFDPKKPGEDVRLERPDFASYVHASARALSQGLIMLGEEEEARRFEALAEGIEEAVLTRLWHSEDAIFHTLRDGEITQVPGGEVMGFYPFFSRLLPDEPPYLAALNVLGGMFENDDVDQDDIPSPHAASVIAEAMANALRYYGPSKVTGEVFSRFLKGYTRRHFENNDPERPVLFEPIHEEMGRDFGCPDLFQSTYNDLLIRFIGGLVPCAEGRIELWPLVEDLEYFRFRNIPYHGRLLDIAWDRPDGERVYADIEEGYTLMKDGKWTFTVQELKRMILD